MFKYPMPGAEMVVVKFTQSYQSSNYQGRLRKQQYWKKDNSGHWRIVFEG